METKTIIKEPVAPQCGGCENIEYDHVQHVCKRYAMPAARWRRGNCPMATHIKKEATTAVKLNPLKASKRSVKGG